MSLARLIARPLLASSFVWSGVERLRRPEETGRQLEPGLRRLGTAVPPLAPLAQRPRTVGRIVGGVQIGAAALLALGRFPRLSASLLAATAALTAVGDTATSAGGRTPALLKNFSLAGGVLLASVDTAGRPSLAWRARRLGTGARRELGKAGQLGRPVRTAVAEVRRSAKEVIGH
ncbi:hypothetical protein NCCP1664_25420 [Zafaria cholistanensis]|uniref:DoxX family protein n=1 Tax=Zafaria cholistanensis TaxID=1682741 RepID=A0A5A7NVA5_9MICC|nr:DoxX family membrane protein [Zafaria cholistanensis]GER24047.1 hypothetical protein NCCP1664_25420 [Zafaria cholistanensis]